MQRLHPTVSLLTLGFAMAVTQTVLLREAMTALGGSELSWGWFLALWLAGMGLGSRLGVRWGGVEVMKLAPMAATVLAGVGAVLLRWAPAASGASPGEALTTSHAWWIWVAAVVPVSCAGGMAFPVLAEALGERSGARPYALEAIGALAGGLLFSAVLCGLGSAVALAITAGLVATTGWWRGHPLICVGVVVATVAAGMLAEPLLARQGWRWSGRPADLRAWNETRHQRLELSTGTPSALYGNGRLLASFPEPYLTVPRAHLVMLLHPRPQRVLAVGCAADGSILPMLEHPIERLVLAEEDSALLPALSRWYGPGFARALSDPRSLTSRNDPLRALSSGNDWDLVVLLDGGPTTVRANRTRTLEFLSICKRRMAPDGVLVVRTGVNDTYLGGGAGRLLEILSSTLRRVFPRVIGIPGEDVLLVAGAADAHLTIDPGELERRLVERAIDDPRIPPGLLTLMVDPSRQHELGSFVEDSSAPVNTSDRPRAVLLAAALSEGRTVPGLLTLVRAIEQRSPAPLAAAAAALTAVLLVIAATRRGAGPAAGAVVGFGSLTWWLLLLTVWQSAIGSVYAEVGALSATFMAGLAGGALTSRRWSAPQRHLPLLLAGSAVLSGLIAFGAPGLLPLLLVPAMLAGGGWITGGAFAGVAELSGRGNTRRGLGRGFAADEIGAACAAIIVGVVALPWAGGRATAAALALLQLATLPVVWRGLRTVR